MHYVDIRSCFFGSFGSLEPAFTNFMYEKLVLETWYDVKKLFIDIQELAILHPDEK